MKRFGYDERECLLRVKNRAKIGVNPNCINLE